jgi:hypothetical protein
MHPVIVLLSFTFVISNVACKVSLISLIGFSKTVEGLQSDIRAVKEYASDLQTLLGSKVIEEEVKKEEESLMALSETDYLFLT